MEHLYKYLNYIVNFYHKIFDDDIVAVNSKPDDIKKPKIREAYNEKERARN